MRVRALYDFDGESNTSEISIASGEILQVTRRDVGEGWWEGTNSKGQTGLFPAAYVEELSDVVKPAIAPLSASSTSSNNQETNFPQPPQTAPPRYDQTADDVSEHPDDWEDDWDDDQDTYSEIGPPPPQSSIHASASNQQHQAVAAKSSYDQQPSRPIEADTMSISSNMPIKSKSKIFSKSGDSYILASVTPPVSDKEKVYIVNNERGFFWHRTNEPYTVSVRSPKKETKFKGMKSFIAYHICPSYTGIAVSFLFFYFFRCLFNVRLSDCPF